MVKAALDAADLAAEFGRSADWIYEHWQMLVAAKRIPRPVNISGGLAWNTAQVYALLDRDLTPSQRATAVAFRAALAAAASADDDLATADTVADARRRLAERFGKPGAPLIPGEF